jgi:hypothetical protein
MRKIDTSTTWQQLTSDQQTYLEAIYRADQDTERHSSRRSSSVPASRWRWLPFDRTVAISIPTALTPLFDTLRHTDDQIRRICEDLQILGLVEQSIQVMSESYSKMNAGKRYFAVQITKQGRALVRAEFGSLARLTDRQVTFARQVAELGLASVEEAATAFLNHNDTQIEAWRPTVQAARAHKDAYPMIIIEY